MDVNLPTNFYVWQRPDWPDFHWDAQQLIPALGRVSRLDGVLSGQMSMLGLEDKGLAQVEALTSELLGSARIEGVALDDNSVRSSFARKLGVELDIPSTENHYVEGLVEVMLDAVRCSSEALTKERLFNWHSALFPTGRSGIRPITVGQWQHGEEPMVVVSGALGKEKIHFVAPPSERIEGEMTTFLQWFHNADLPDFLKAGVASFWFVTVHPFDDGNGRISRTIAEMVLSRHDCGKRYFSLSAQMDQNRAAYYEALQRAQHGNGDLTSWLLYFLDCLERAITQSINTLKNTLEKAVFWEAHSNMAVNERQRKIINRLWDSFEGKLNTTKYAKINHCSQDTALRDIRDLEAKGILRDSGEKGRNTNYILCK